jgi:hypothetical protein
MEQKTPNDPDLGIALELARDQLGYRLNALDGLDAKAGGVFASACTLAAILVAIVALRPSATANPLAILAGAVAGCAWLAVATLTFLSTWARDADFGPNPHDQAICEANNSQYDAQRYALKTAIASITCNANLQEAKARLVNLGLFALASETLALLVFGLLVARG